MQDSDKQGRETDANERQSSNADPRVLLFMQSGRNRELLVETLEEPYTVETATDVRTLNTKFDCCVFGSTEFNRVAGTVQSRRDTAKPVFLPFVLLVGENDPVSSAEAWEYVDDIVHLPADKTALLARIRNLIERRQTGIKLSEREDQLEQTIENLKLKERTMNEAPIGITIADTGDEDNPLLYVNEQFEEMTEYSSDVLGKDCRFLQGEGTNPDTTARIREAMDDNRPVSVDILNYTKRGKKFWNKLDITPLRDDSGSVTHFVGFQTEITKRKLRERRLEVLNRVLGHNLRNKMSLIEGYLSLFREEHEDLELSGSLREVETAADDLMGLTDTVQKIENTLDGAGTSETAIQLDKRLEELVSSFDDRFPEATVKLTVPGTGDCAVDDVGLVTAIEEACENAVKHNDAPEPVVEVTVERSSNQWIEVTVEDNGPGIPSQEIDVLHHGETPLQHADRLGIWLMYWVVSNTGGRFRIGDADSGGTRVEFSIPASTAS